MRQINLLLVLFLIVGLTACQRKQMEETIQLMWWGDRYNREFAMKFAEAYNKTASDKKISVFTASDYWIKLQTMLAGGMAPDIFILDTNQSNQLAERGSLYPLDDYKDDPTYEISQEGTWENLKGEFTYKGHLYAMPIWTNTIGIFYNKDLFDRAGVKYPDEDWDLNELLEMAKLLTKDTDGDGRKDQYGFGGYPLAIGEWALNMLVEGFGGEFYSEDLSRCLIDTPVAIEAVRWAVELVTKHHVVPPEFLAMNPDIGVFGVGSMDMFRMGKVAMVMWGRWYIDVLSKQSNIRWGAVHFPKGKKEVMHNTPIYLSIFSGTKYPKECWEFLKFVTSKEGQRILATDRSEIPILRSIAYSSEFLNYADREDANKVFLEMMDYSEIPRYALGKDKWKDFARDKLALVVRGQLGLEEACQQIASEFQRGD